MERLTFSKGFKESEELGELKHVSPEFGKQVHERLAAYEDTGLTPERCAELAKAEQEGRLIELPCKIGDAVYVVRHAQDHYADEPYLTINVKAFTLDMLPHFGGTVFLSRQEAEKALESEV